jgi:hypothetical protein
MSRRRSFSADNPRPYRCGAFGTTTGRQCMLHSDHGGPHVLETVCSAEIGVDGRVGCDCMKGMPELKADLAVCHGRLVDLIEQSRR